MGQLDTFVWYTISSGPEEGPLEVPRATLVGWLAQAGITDQLLAPAARSVDAFRLASSGMTDTYTVGGQRFLLSVVETKKSSEHVNRAVMVHTVAAEGTEEAKQVAVLQFFRPHRTGNGLVKGTERLRTAVYPTLRGEHRVRVQAFVDAIVVRYREYQDGVRPHALRAALREFLTVRGGVPIPDSGGVYLIGGEHLPQLRALAEVINRCGPGCRLRLPSEASDRAAMAVEAIEAQYADRAGRLRADVEEWFARRSRLRIPEARTWDHWATRLTALQDGLMTALEAYPGEEFPRAVAAVEGAVDAIEVARGRGRPVSRGVSA